MTSRPKLKLHNTKNATWIANIDVRGAPPEAVLDISHHPQTCVYDVCPYYDGHGYVDVVVAKKE